MSMGWSEKLVLTIHVKVAPPTAPTAPPSPTTVETAEEGNMSVGVENRLAAQSGCAAAARANSAPAGHALLGEIRPIMGTSMMGIPERAQTSRAILRPPLVLKPRFMSWPDSHPPAMDPTLETA